MRRDSTARRALAATSLLLLLLLSCLSRASLTLADDKTSHSTLDADHQECPANLVNVTANLERADDDARLMNWLLENGARLDGVIYPVVSPNGERGIAAKKRITPGKSAFYIPSKCILTTANLYKHPVLGPHMATSRRFNESHEDYVGHAPLLGLAIFIALEKAKGPSSFYYPYLAALPTPSGLETWTKEELEDFQDASFIKNFGSTTKLEQLEYERMILSDPNPGIPPDVVTNEAFVWALRILRSRAFEISVTPEELQADPTRKWTWYLLPLIDMMNHNNNGTMAFELTTGTQMIEDLKLDPDETYDMEDPDKATFVRLYSYNAKFEPGDELTTVYGSFGSYVLMRSYGFALKKNWYDVRLLPLRDPAMGDSPEAEVKRRIFAASTGVSSSGERGWVDPDPVFQERAKTLNITNPIGVVTVRPNLGIVEFFRLVVADQETALREDFIDLVREPSDFDTEIMALTGAARFVREDFKIYPTSIQEDELELTKCLTSKKRTAITYRLAWKRMLQTQIDFFNIARTSAMKKETELRKMSRKDLQAFFNKLYDTVDDMLYGDMNLVPVEEM